jgi:hypothetical protein
MDVETARARIAGRPDLPVVAVHRAVVVDVEFPEGECVHAVVLCPACQTIIYTDDDGCCDAPDRTVAALGVEAWGTG